MATLTLRPTSATGTSWQNTGRVYDGSTTQAATVSINSSNYSQRTLTVNFSTSSIPQNAQITKATLTVIAKQSSSNSSRRITVQADINGSSSNRVINQQLTLTSNTTLTADIVNYMSNLSSLVITGVTSATSYSSQTFSIYEIYVDVEYEVSVEYTITYRYLCDGQSIKTSTTEKVTSGTYKTFNINNAPLIDGYTVLSVSPTSATINSDTTVTFTYKKNVVGTTVDIYLPQPLGTGDRLYWNEAEGKYYIEHSTGIIQTEITQKIEFDNYANLMTVQVDDSQVAPSSMTAWIAKKEVSSGGEPSEGEWVKATLRQGMWNNVNDWVDLTEEYYYSSDIIYMTDANRLSWDITGAAAGFITAFQIYFFNDYVVGAVAGGDYEGTISLDVFDYLDATAISIMILTYEGINPTDINLSYKTHTESTSSDPITPGEWQDATMQVGRWTAVEQWSNSEIQNSNGAILRSSELIDIRNKDVLEVKIPSTATGELFFYEDEYYAGGIMFMTDDFTVNLKNLGIPNAKWVSVGIYTRNANTATQYRLSTSSGGGDSGGDSGEIVIDTVQGYDDSAGWTNALGCISTDKIPYTGDIYIKVTPTDPNDTRRYLVHSLSLYDENGEYASYVMVSNSPDCTNVFELVCDLNSLYIPSGIKYIRVEIYPHLEDVEITPDDVIVTYKIVNGSGGGTDQEGDWVEANMRVGTWNSINEFSAEEYEYNGLYQHNSEVIYLDGLKEIHVQAENYDQDIGIGVSLFSPSGENVGIVDIYQLSSLGLNAIDISELYENAEIHTGYTAIAMSFAVMGQKNVPTLRYKLIR